MPLSDGCLVCVGGLTRKFWMLLNVSWRLADCSEDMGAAAKVLLFGGGDEGRDAVFKSSALATLVLSSFASSVLSPADAPSFRLRDSS